MKLSVGFERYTSCSGCQLTLLGCGEGWAEIEKFCNFVDFPLLGALPPGSPFLDLALAEGSISSSEELERLLRLRRRSKLLIAVGACALSGGINSLASGEESLRAPKDGAVPFILRPLAAFVRIDGIIPGCPPEQEDYLRLFGTLLQGGLPEEYALPVCMECRLRENRCLLLENAQPCLGGVTRGGCSARCPTYGLPCEGCRGAVPEANDQEEVRLLLQAGLPATEIRSRLERFRGRGG